MRGVTMTFTIDITEVATTEYVAVAFIIVFCSTYNTAMNVSLSLSEYIAVGVEGTYPAEVVVTLTASEDVTQNVAVNQLHLCLTIFIYLVEGAYAVLVATHVDIATSDSSNLATTEEAVTYITAPHLHVGEVNTTVVNISAAEDVTTT